MIVSCTQTTTTNNTSSTTTSTQTTGTSPTTQTTQTSPQATSTTTQTSTTQPPPTAGNWWDKFGTPQYGGTIIARTFFVNPGSWDPAAGMGIGAGGFATNNLFEELTFPDWTLDRTIWSYPTGFTPLQYLKGALLESWTQEDPQSFTVKVRQGIKWQNKAPANGRAFTAEDIAYNFDRACGTGHGFTTGLPTMISQLTAIKKVEVIDQYTVKFTFTQPGIIGVYQILGTMFPMTCKEFVDLPGAGQTDWKNAIGTGPWTLTDFVGGTSMTFSKNPDYWGFDERYPKNKLPYADAEKILAIADPSTAIAAFTTDKVDVMTDLMGSLNWQQAQSIQKDNPNVQIFWLPNSGATVLLRCDTVPFKDIRVRTALQMAIDTKTIASGYYGGTVDWRPGGLLGPALKGWMLPYDQWTSDLQAQYTFNIDDAKALLKDAGYPNGFSTNVIAPNNQDLNLLQVIKAMFAEIGVQMEIRAYDAPTATAMQAAGLYDQMVYNDGQAVLLWAPTTSLGQRLSTAPPSSNGTFNNDKDYDALFAKMMTALTTDELSKDSIAADQYALTQHWSVNITVRSTPIMVQSYIKGYSGEIPVDVAWNGGYRARMWIDQSLKK
jgi:peptide/nickel transport system substrate-binding protein